MEISGAWRAALILLATTAVALGDAAPQPAPELLSYSIRKTASCGGERIHYVVDSRETLLPGADGTPGATIFSFSYLRQGARNADARPVLFVFNGGPGSSSVWLHLGFFGPQRVKLTDPVNPPTVPPFELEANPFCSLDVADLVVIDPVGTGYARLLAGARPEQYFGTEADAKATVQFIEGWLNQHGRWNSPKFLVGESYGTIRAAVMAREVAGGPFSGTGRLTAISLNGIVMMGQSLPIEAGATLTNVNALPSMAATAWHHEQVDRRGRSLDAFVTEAAAFAADEYLRALYAGDALDAAGRQRVAERLANFIGLPAAFLLERDLRVDMGTFRSELLREAGKQVGAYDSRYVLAPPAAGVTPDPVGDDPAMAQYTPAFVAAMNRYLREELKIVVERPYEAIAFRSVNSKWDYSPSPGPGSATPTQSLAAAMRRNPQLHLFFATGHFDLVTTVGAANYLIAHAGLPQERVTARAYASGHMPYLGDASAAKLATDLRAFITAASR